MAPMALVSFTPMSSETASTSPQRAPSGMAKRCSPRARKIAFCASVNVRPCCRSSSAIASVGLILPLVAEALVEHQRQDVVLVILPGGLAPEDVGRAPEMRFELLLG